MPELMQQFKDSKVGLALGGGAVYGAAHIGVLRAIEENNIKIESIAGTSIGALVASLYAFGFNWKDIQSIALELKWLEVARIRLSKYALLSNYKLRDLVLKHIGDVNFEDAKIPLSMIATNIVNGKKVILDSGNVARAVMASTCIPGVFSPVKYEDGMLVDGGLVENVPISPLRSRNMDSIIAVDLNAKGGIQKPTSIIDIMVNSFQLVLSTASYIHAKTADILICPDLSEFKRTDLNKAEKMIEVGYSTAMEAFEKAE